MKSRSSKPARGKASSKRSGTGEIECDNAGEIATQAVTATGQSDRARPSAISAPAMHDKAWLRQADLLCKAFGSTLRIASAGPLVDDAAPSDPASRAARLARQAEQRLDPGSETPESLASHVAKLEAESTSAFFKAHVHTSVAIETQLVAPAVRPKKRKPATSTAGPAWYNLPAPVMTPELQREVDMIMLRPYMDNKHHSRPISTDGKAPRFFQMGTVVAGRADAPGERVLRRNKATSLVDEVLRNDKIRTFAKRKYSELQNDANSRRGRPAKKPRH